jgi:hypothetical protein
MNPELSTQAYEEIGRVEQMLRGRDTSKNLAHACSGKSNLPPSLLLSHPYIADGVMKWPNARTQPRRDCGVNRESGTASAHRRWLQ